MSMMSSSSSGLPSIGRSLSTNPTQVLQESEHLQAASTALGNDDEHARISRELYRPKFEAAERLFGNRFGFYQPQGGMFLWLEVGDCEEAAQCLWQRAGVRVLPGKYMSVPDEDGNHPGAGYIRIALVPDLETTIMALERAIGVLEDMN